MSREDEERITEKCLRSLILCEEGLRHSFRANGWTEPPTETAKSASGGRYSINCGHFAKEWEEEEWLVGWVAKRYLESGKSNFLIN